MASVRAQCHSLLGRIEGLGSGSVTAAGRRRKAVEMERQWRRERQTNIIILICTGFFYSNNLPASSDVFDHLFVI